jgi:hypothetical protein
LRREGFVDLEQIDLGERDAGLLEQPANGRRGSDPHLRRIDADHVPADDLRHRLQPVARGSIAVRDHQARGTVHHSAGVAGRDGSVFAERGLQLRHTLDGGLHEEMVVLVDLNRLGPLLISTGTISSAKTPLLAAFARCMLRNAYVSCFSREMPMRLASFSAVCAIKRPQ